MISFDQNVCSNFGEAIEKEWLETNGIGGYASSTIIGANTRGYHGLLIAAMQPPVGRVLLLSKLEETLVIGDRRYEVSCNQYPGALYPEGHKYLSGFKQDLFPVFTYVVEDTVVEKSIIMLHDSNTTLVNYKLIGSKEAVKIELRPLVACRDFHERMHENVRFSVHIQRENGSIAIANWNARFYLSAQPGENTDQCKAEFRISGYWYRNLEYQVEAYRGQASHEDLYNPGYFVCELAKGESINVVVSTDDPADLDSEKARLSEIERRKSISDAKTEDQNLKTLLMAADQFIVKRGDLHSIIAGYHWFGDWGRDTMIALPGLTLVTKKYDVAKGILRTYAQYCDRGMIPNRFPEEGEQPDYNTVDASLWFCQAVKKYLDYTGDLDFIKSEIFPILTQIIQHYMNGTRYGIHMDTDGLIYAGQEGTQLTWMDAKIGDLVVTPRRGKAVEINALWYNALRFMEECSLKLGQSNLASNYASLSEKTKQNFERVFWNDDENSLYDYIDGDYRDPAIRPNQIFAISLPYQLLTTDKAKAVLEVVQRDLLTPFGLRSLSPKHENYVGHYGGDSYSRDTAYHQGTVWGWLLGPFISAYMNVNGKTRATQEFAREAMSEIIRHHLSNAGLGTISEIFDGDPPHNPRGCIAQAWSVAEILRAYFES